jgi:cell shape-determining protein MreD
MNWIVAAIVAWVLMGVEKGLRGALELGASGVAPSFVFAFAAFLALVAQPGPALWTCLVLGLLVDLTNTLDLRAGGSATIVGPYALGFLLAGQLVLTLRGVMISRNPLTLGFLSLVGGVVCQLTVLAILGVRNLIAGDLAWSPADQLLPRLASSLYTGALAVGLALALFPLQGALGVGPSQGRRFARRIG